MSYPPYRNPYEDRDFRQRGEREGRRFRRDYDEEEDRGFESESYRSGRGQFEERFGRGQFEDWEQPRRFGSEAGRGGWGQGDWRPSEWQQAPRRGSRRGEWQSQQRYGRGEGGGYGYGEGGYPGGRYSEGRWGESRRFDEGGGFDESRRQQRFGSESEFGGGYSGFEPQRGQFAGRGPKNYRRSDQRIQEDVCDRLTSDPQIDASEIQVNVKDGEITLEGTVNERRMKRLAEDCAESVAGVNQVHNRLRVEEEGAGRREQSSQHGKEQQGREGQTGSTRQGSGRTSNL